MNEHLAKEQRRNLRREMGATATDALERARAEVLKLRMEHAAIARELVDYKAATDKLLAEFFGEQVRLNHRIDGASAWCEKNEQCMQTCVRETEKLRRWRVELEGASVWRRLGWVLTGVVYRDDDPCCEMCGGRDFHGHQCRTCLAAGKVRVAPTQTVIE